jgi:hypothetical protein
MKFLGNQRLRSQKLVSLTLVFLLLVQPLCGQSQGQNASQTPSQNPSKYGLAEVQGQDALHVGINSLVPAVGDQVLAAAINAGGTRAQAVAAKNIFINTSTTLDRLAERASLRGGLPSPTGSGGLSGVVFVGSDNSVLLARPQTPPSGARPAAGATVNVGSVSVKTDSAGAFNLQKIPTGLAVLHVATAAGQSGDFPVTIFGGVTAILGPPKVTRAAALAKVMNALAAEGTNPQATIVIGPQEPLPPGTTVAPIYGDKNGQPNPAVDYTTRTEQWFIYVDSDATIRYAKPVEFFFVDAVSAALTKMDEMSWPLINGLTYYGNHGVNARSADLMAGPQLTAKSAADNTSARTLKVSFRDVRYRAALPALKLTGGSGVPRGPLRARLLTASSRLHNLSLLYRSAMPQSQTPAWPAQTYALLIEGEDESSSDRDISTAEHLLGNGGIPPAGDIQYSTPADTTSSSGVGARREDLIAKFQKVCSEAGPNDTVFIYISAHGRASNVDGVRMATNGTDKDGSSIEVELLGSASFDFSNCRPCNIIIIIDACYSAVMASHLNDQLKKLPCPPNYTIIASADATHGAAYHEWWQLSGWTGGVFSNSFRSAFDSQSASSPDGNVDLSKVFDAAKEDMSNTWSYKNRIAEQNPQIFVRNPRCPCQPPTPTSCNNGQPGTTQPNANNPTPTGVSSGSTTGSPNCQPTNPKNPPPPTTNQPPSSTTAGGSTTPQPPTPPAPQTPAQVCPECIIYLQAVIELRNELAQVQMQIAAQNASIANNQLAQRAIQAKIAALQAALAGQQGIGGSGYDPATGLTTESITQADGTVLVTVRDANGNILQQSVRNRSDLASTQSDLSAAQAQLALLKTEGAALAKERDLLVAKQQRLAARLQDAIQQLADCLEKKCSHLVGQRLNTIAEQFGLDPQTGKPVPPKGTSNVTGSSASGGNTAIVTGSSASLGNPQVGNAGPSTASNAAETAAGNAANKANETNVSTPPMQNGAGVGNVKPAGKGALPGGDASSGESGNNNGNNNGADNGANNGNAGDNPPPQPPAANPQPAAEKRPPDYRHAQPSKDSSGAVVPNQYSVTVCEGTNDYVFRASGGEVTATNVTSTSFNPSQPPDATGVGFGNGIRISGNHVGASPIEADFVRFDGTLAAHVKIIVTVIDCSYHTAVVPGGNSPPAKANPPVDSGGGGNQKPPDGGDDNPPAGENGENPNLPTGGDTGGRFMGVLDEANSSFFGNALGAPTVQNIVITININTGASAPSTAAPATPSSALQVLLQRVPTAQNRSFAHARARFKLVAYHSGSPSRAPSTKRSFADLDSSKFSSALPSAEGLAFSIVASGNLGSKAIEFRVHDPSGRLKGNIALPEGMVLEPLKVGTRNPVSTANGKNILSQQLTAYCLDMAKLPPEPGQLYRLAPRAVQQKYIPIKAILEVGRKLAAQGRFHPDSEANAYADFVRQHALWAELEHWTEQKFTEVFLERTKKNAEHLNVKWTNEMTEALRAAAPGRWRDIAMVLDEAHKLSGAAGVP